MASVVTGSGDCLAAVPVVCQVVSVQTGAMMPAPGWSM